MITHTSAGDRGPVARVGGRVGKSGKSGVSHGKGEGHVVHAGVNCVCNVCGSAHSCGCVVNGSFARAAFCVLIIDSIESSTCTIHSFVRAEQCYSDM